MTVHTSHFSVLMILIFAHDIYSSDYIDSSFRGNLLERRILLMLTIDNLIAVLALCATFYGLGYVHGQHDSKTQK